MIFTYYILIISLGAIVGSFANVVAHRLNSGRTILTGRSRCDSCAEELSPVMLVPVFSFVLLRGRCAMCGSKIGTSHVLAEVVLGAFFGAALYLHGISFALLLSLIFLTLLTSIVIYDLRHTIIPNLLVYPLILIGGLMAYMSGDLYAAIVAACTAAFFAAIWLFSGGRAMGFGDAKLVFALALFVGYPIAITGFMLSFWIGAVISVALLVFYRKGRTMSNEVPFAPYLALGFLCAYFLQLNLLPSVFF
ncbi:prepilin peptidase [Candidatus Wolfebacteria bacterium]|nr:prepilin peptidase [Candidatus Wolfebacteria bacterium]